MGGWGKAFLISGMGLTATLIMGACCGWSMGIVVPGSIVSVVAGFFGGVSQDHERTKAVIASFILCALVIPLSDQLSSEEDWIFYGFLGAQNIVLSLLILFVPVKERGVSKVGKLLLNLCAGVLVTVTVAALADPQWPLGLLLPGIIISAIAGWMGVCKNDERTSAGWWFFIVSIIVIAIAAIFGAEEEIVSFPLIVFISLIGEMFGLMLMIALIPVKSECCAELR